MKVNGPPVSLPASLTMLQILKVFYEIDLISLIGPVTATTTKYCCNAMPIKVFKIFA
jgi:hypothetical protein